MADDEGVRRPWRREASTALRTQAGANASHLLAAQVLFCPCQMPELRHEEHGPAMGAAERADLLAQLALCLGHTPSISAPSWKVRCHRFACLT